MLEKARRRSKGAGETARTGSAGEKRGWGQRVRVWAPYLECCEQALAAWAVASACGLVL